jgi:hypothetical protein
VKRFHTALTELTLIDGQVCHGNGQRFDRESYSRFKHGWLPPAAEYARDLVGVIAAKLWCLGEGHPIRIVSAPYKFLPTASHAIAEYTRDYLGELAVEQGIEPPVLVPLHKANTGNSSYARSSAADRKAELQSLGLRIDESLVTDSVMLVVDDIRITGAAERATAAYLEPLSPYVIWYLHAAHLSEYVALKHPGLEDELNQSLPHNLERFLQESAHDEFQLNTRVLRLILESDADKLRDFIVKAPTWLVSKIYQSAVGSGVTYYNRHQDSLRIVRYEQNWRHSSLVETS